MLLPLYTQLILSTTQRHQIQQLIPLLLLFHALIDLKIVSAIYLKKQLLYQPTANKTFYSTFIELLERVTCIHCHQFLLSHSLFNLFWPRFCFLIPKILSHKMINDMHIAQPKSDLTWHMGSIGQSWNSLPLGTISSLNFHDITISLFHTYALVIYSPIL